MLAIPRVLRTYETINKKLREMSERKTRSKKRGKGGKYFLVDEISNYGTHEVEYLWQSQEHSVLFLF